LPILVHGWLNCSSVTGACFLRFLGIVAADSVAGAAGLGGAAGVGAVPEAVILMSLPPLS
jgi:hypothetical protein